MRATLYLQGKEMSLGYDPIYRTLDRIEQKLDLLLKINKHILEMEHTMSLEMDQLILLWLYNIPV